MHRLLLFLGFQLLGAHVFAQVDHRIDLECKACSLAEIVEKIQAQTDISFAYQSELLEGRVFDISWTDTGVEEAISTWLFSNGIEYVKLDEGYVVLRQIRELEHAEHLFCGTIIDQLSQEPLVGAYVVYGDGAQGTQTNADGYFEFGLPKYETLQATISYIGYKDLLVNISKKSEEGCPTFHLALDLENMPIATISEFTVDMLKPEPAKNRYRFEPQEIPTLPGWGEPDVLRSLQLLPGISSPDGTASDLQIRGSSSDQNLVLWDGITIYQTGHFFGQYSAFNPYLIESVDVYRGGFDAQYGGRLAGIIDINSSSNLGEEARYGFGANLVSAHALAEIPLIPNKLGLTLGARRSFADLFPSGTYRNLFDVVFQNSRLTDNENEIADLGIDDIEVTTDFFFEDLNLRLDWQADDDNAFGFSAYSGRDRFDYDFRVLNIGSRDELDIGNWGMSTWYERKWSDRSKSWARLAYSNFRRDYRLTYSFNLMANPEEVFVGQDNAIGDLNFSWRHEWQLGKKHKLEIGGQFLNQQIDFSYSERRNENELDFTGFDFLATTEAWHTTYTWQPNQRWDISLGLRRVSFLNRLPDDIPLLSDRSWQPRWRLLWKAQEMPLTFKIAGGWYRQFLYQVPLALDELSSDDELWIVAGNYFPSLRSRDWQAEATLTAGNFFFSAEYFHKFTDNISARDLSVAFEPNDPLKFRGTAQAKGFDLLLRYRHKRYRAWLAYSNTLVDQTFTEGTETVVLPPDFNQRHRLNFTHMLSLPKWDFSLNWEFGSGRPFTQPLGISEGEIDGNVTYALRYDLPNQNRLPANHRLDIAANYKFVRPKWRGKLGLSIYNLYDQYNAFDYDHYVLPPDAEFDRFDPEIVRLERRMLGFTPNLFLQLEW
ncbi:MAG: TonB-dependent receptor plug domain-containing protein [Bacteroidota bacterium]